AEVLRYSEMACPCFDPGERLPGRGGSLGDLYTGLCRAAESVKQPDEHTVAERCNLGYARGRCAHFPADAPSDAVRFSVAKHEPQAIRIRYSLERDHRPVANGVLEYSPAAASFVDAPDAAVGRLGSAYVRSYLRRIAK